MTDFQPYKKGDVIALIETRVTQYAIGSGRPAETSHSIRIVRVESAARDGKSIKSYRTYPTSPVYKYENRYNRFKLMTIQSGTTQAAARRLFDGASYFLDYDTAEAAKAAIIAAGEAKPEPASVPFVDVSNETAYGTTVKSSRAIRCF